MRGRSKWTGLKVTVDSMEILAAWESKIPRWGEGVRREGGGDGGEGGGLTRALPREIRPRERDALHAIYVCHRGGVLAVVARIPWPLSIDRAPPRRFAAGWRASDRVRGPDRRCVADARDS